MYLFMYVFKKKTKHVSACCKPGCIGPQRVTLPHNESWRIGLRPSQDSNDSVGGTNGDHIKRRSLCEVSNRFGSEMSVCVNGYDNKSLYHVKMEQRNI